MRKTLSIGLAIAGVFIGAAVAQAQIITCGIDYCGSGTYLGETYKNITGAWYLRDFDIPFLLNEIPCDSILTGGTLSITHTGNKDTMINLTEHFSVPNPSVWEVYADDICLGKLSASPCYLGWKTDTFTLDQGIFSCLRDSTPWSLVASLQDPTWLPDCLSIDKACLTLNCVQLPDGDNIDGDGAPVPEPGSMLLFLSGFTGLAGLGIRKAALFR